MARLSPFVPFGLVLAFLAWLWPFGPVFGLSDTLYNLTIREIEVICMCSAIELSTVFLNMVYKRVCRNCPISSCGVKYLVRLANHLADVRQLDHIQRKQYLQEAKLQPKVKVVVYKSEADNSGKNHLTSTRNQYRHKKRCTNCQDHEEMKPLLRWLPRVNWPCAV